MAKNKGGTSPFLPTIISVLSAILGSAIGGFLGLYGGHPIAASIGGLCFGFAAAIPFNIVLLIVAYAILGFDFDPTPYGFSSNTMLSAILGGIGAMISSPVSVLVIYYSGENDVYPLSVLCIVSILVPVVLGVGLIKFGNRSQSKLDNPL